MTGTVVQVFVEPELWNATLGGIYDALRPGGHLVSQTRDPPACGWEKWPPAATRREVQVDGVGGDERWHEVTEVCGLPVTFRTSFAFA